MDKQLQSLQTELRTKHIVQNFFQNELKKETPQITNARYVKLLKKTAEIESEILRLKSQIKQIRKLKRAELFINLSSRVKLISIEFEVTLWVDAKNLNELIGKKVGEIVEIYNAKYKVAEVY